MSSHGISCTFFRCRKGMGRFGQFWLYYFLTRLCLNWSKKLSLLLEQADLQLDLAVEQERKLLVELWLVL